MCLLPFLPLSPVTAFLGGLCFLAASCPSLCGLIIVPRAFFCGYCAAAASCRSLRYVWCVLYGFLLQPSFCAAARIGSCPESGLNHACVWEAIFFLVFLGAVFSCSLFVRRFFALRPCVCPCAWCFRLCGLKHVCLPFSPRVSPTERLDSCLLCLRNPCFFLLGAASSRSACAAVLRPASLCLLACFVFLLERSQCCLLALPLVYFCQGVA